MDFLTASFSGQPEFLKNITEPLEAAWFKIAEIVGALLPKVIGFILILIIGWLLSKLFAFVIKKLLICCDPWRDHAHNFSFDDRTAFNGTRVFNLLADRYPVAGPQQAADVVVSGMSGESGQGDRLLPIPGIAARQRYVERSGGDPGVFEERLVEVPQSEEKDLVGMLSLDPEVLLHEGRAGLRQGRIGVRVCG